MGRARIDSIEWLPTDPAVLLLPHHSGVFGVADLVGFAARWFGQHGVSRAMAGVAHHLGFRLQRLRHLHRQFGSLRTVAAAMRAANHAGVPLLVFPGDEHEVFRAMGQADRIDFGGRGRRCARGPSHGRADRPAGDHAQRMVNENHLA